MAEYCTKDDLESIRPGITTEYDITYVDECIEKAGEKLDRAIESRWYRPAAEGLGIDWKETQFNRDNLANNGSQLTDAATYKALSLICFKMAKIGDEDSYAKESKRFESEYESELKEVLLFGVLYDWDDDDTIDDEEIGIRPVRRLERG